MDEKMKQLFIMCRPNVVGLFVVKEKQNGKHVGKFQRSEKWMEARLFGFALKDKLEVAIILEEKRPIKYDDIFIDKPWGVKELIPDESQIKTVSMLQGCLLYVISTILVRALSLSKPGLLPKTHPRR